MFACDCRPTQGQLFKGKCRPTHTEQSNLGPSLGLTFYTLLLCLILISKLCLKLALD